LSTAEWQRNKIGNLSFRASASEREIFIKVFYKANIGRFLPSVEMTGAEVIQFSFLRKKEKTEALSNQASV
jgi:hypothetical protein